jgi:hypothetical protein
MFKANNGGFSKVTVNVAGGSTVLQELTVAENGTYEPGVSLGSTVSFRDDYSNNTLGEIWDEEGFYGDDVLIETNECRVVIQSSSGIYTLVYENTEGCWIFASQTVVNIGWPISVSEVGWYDFSSLGKVDTPIITLPTNSSQIFIDSSKLNKMFKTDVGCFSKVIVDVEPNLGKIVVSQNGTYIPQTEVQLGGTYIFKEHYTDEELSTLFSLGQHYDDFGHSYYLMNEY